MDSLQPNQIKNRLEQLNTAWTYDGERLERIIQENDLPSAIGVFNRIAKIAAAEGYLPTICLESTEITVKLGSSQTGGVSSADFEMAKKIDKEIP